MSKISSVIKIAFRHEKENDFLFSVRLTTTSYLANDFKLAALNPTTFFFL